MTKENIVTIYKAAEHLFGYGCSLHEDAFRALFGITIVQPEQFAEVTQGMSKSEVKRLIDDETLAELGVADALRNHLHSLGKHISKSGAMYRVALPSENEIIAARYRSKASRALNKAKRLSSATPSEAGAQKSTSASLDFMMDGRK